MDRQASVNVIDSMTGSGKTTKMIQIINEAPTTKKFIFVTPFLDEVERIKKSVTNRQMYEPHNIGGGKLRYLKDMIVAGRNIVTTHALFKKSDEELMTLISSNNYTLVLDEVMDVIKQVGVKKDDLELLIKNEILIVADDGTATWNEAKNFDETIFKYVRDYAESDNLFIHNGVALMWTFPVKCFKAFDSIYILTYMFEAQVQRYYYDIFNIRYNYLAVTTIDGKYEIMPHSEVSIDRGKIRNLINVLDDRKLNEIGRKDYSLSSTWLKDEHGNRRSSIKQLQKNMYNYFTNITKTSADCNMWTTLKHSKNKLKGKRYTKGFVEHNCRATNQYSHKTSLAYSMNKYMLPIISSFLQDKGATVDEDAWALSELIQWVWRSAIRNDEPISIYIPSKRMRMLFLNWLNEDR